MSDVKYFVMRCDECGYVEECTEHATVAGARRIGREEGWTHPPVNPDVSRVRKDLCPTCSEETAA